MLDLVPALEAAIEQLQNHCDALLHRGIEVPGWELVEKERNSEKWKDDEAACKLLPASMVTRKPCTPKQARAKKALTDELNGLIERTEWRETKCQRKKQL
jgi:hypothetical protein